MANQTNILGADSGNFLNLTNALLDVWAKEMLLQTEPIKRFYDVATVRQDLQAAAGTTIKFLKYNAITGDSAIAETATIETGTLSNSTVSLTVTEHAKAVGVSEKLLRSATHDVMAMASTQLGRHYTRQRDVLIRDALLTASNTLYAQDQANRAALGTSHTLDLDTIRQVTEHLAIKKAPKINGDGYIMFIHPHQARSVKSSSGWVNYSDYANPNLMVTGEIGRIDDVRFVETTLVPYIPAGTQDIYSDGADSGNNTAVAANGATDVYLSVAVGQNAVGWAESLPVELRDNGIEDFGRKRSLAWYGIFGAGLIEDAHAVVVETA